mmetsp:Transcript_34775/g.92774  ORF Transcript_34775/g.92774 Transcript_34775/m.92774 type:complete len:118 (-) Transcript_34775:1447-1800(-)
MQDVTIRRSLDRNNELFAMHSRQGRVMMEGIGTSMEAERKRAVQAVQRAARTVDPPPSKNPLDGFPMPHVWALVVTAVTCSICCVMMVVVSDKIANHSKVCLDAPQLRTNPDPAHHH